jgi:hypothetical protein
VTDLRTPPRTALWKRQAWQRIAVAAAVSGAVHAAAIAFGRIHLPPAPTDLPPLAVRLAETAMRPPARPEVSRVKARPQRSASVVVASRAAVAVTEPHAEPEYDRAQAQAAEERSSESEAPPAEPVIVATAPASVQEARTRGLPDFPRSGRISYNLVYGPDHVPVGRTVQSWKIEGTRYQLASRSETTGLIDIIRSQHRTYLSRGELTHEGLRPEVFLMSRDRGRGVEEARAQFDWARGSVILGAAVAPRAEVLPQGSQDIVSLLYQLALDPPAPGRMQVSVTNGRRLETYVLDVLAEEKIETPLGVLRALPVKQVRKPGAESVDVWLATEYRHLPVRVRFYGRDGEPAGEQIVTEIRLSDG